MSGTRITNSMMARTVLSDLNQVANRLTETQRKLSSGKEINRPSDDPYGAGRALALRSELEAIEQHSRNVDEAVGWQTVTDTALGTIGDLAQRARELVVQGATDTLDVTSRNAIAQEIDQIIAGMKQEANATYDGRYVLAGTNTDVRPYDPSLQATPNDAFAGNSTAQLREIGPGVTLAVNVTGDEVLGGTATASGDMIDVLRDVATHMRAGDTNALGTTDLKAVTAEIENLLAVRARVGASINRLDTAKSRLAEIQESATKMLSNVEDADMAKTIIDFNTQQAVYQSALKAGAQVIQPSLLDFLR
jgi:flagellar hook-associated protein 3 FlgL